MWDLGKPCCDVGTGAKTSSHRVVLSTIVRWVNPREGGKDPKVHINVVKLHFVHERCQQSPDHGSESLAVVKVSGLWSTNAVNGRASNRKLKCRMGEVEAEELPIEGAVLPVVGAELVAEKGERLPG
ncbi:hypothetical protein AAFF_G00392120 [Aldrovandia affinis]|uniref:Uncharacterized protein n=1 Tax=Aldrovandia affinis TaxID=143900 RepID=A0AAD7WL69_9TELE|nr:hypothetical protein AAFF_G00392120 [Aldrovandia affinis]